MASIKDNANLSGRKKIQYCAYCGAKLTEGTRFCSSCGKPVFVSDNDMNEASDTNTISKNTNTHKVDNTQAKDEVRESIPSQEEKLITKCPKCGAELVEGATFCHVCGTPLNQAASKIKPKTEREKTYTGKIIKCPNCGEVLDAFVSTCPSCGYELREVGNSSALQEFATLVSNTKTDRDKINVIRNFPIPNTKEDILEFSILASTNINENQNIDDEVSDAWFAKLQQAYQKADLSFKDQPEFLRVENIYNQIKELRDENKKNKDLSAFTSSITPKTLVIFIWLLSIFILTPFCRWFTSGDGNWLILGLLMLDMLYGAIFISGFCKGQDSLPRVLAISGKLLSLLVVLPGFLLNLGDLNGDLEISYMAILSMGALSLIFMLISIYDHKSGKTVKTTFEKSTVIITAVCLLICLLAFGVSSFAVSFHTNKGLKAVITNSTYQWPESGYSTYLPQPTEKYGEIVTNNDSGFSIELYQVSQNDFKEYTNACKDNGFTIIDTNTDSYFTAYNQEEYELSISYDSSKKQMNVRITPPMEMSEIRWPDTELTAQIPKPESNIGRISTDSSNYFTVYIANVTTEQFDEYVDECMEMGFTENYSRREGYFYARNEEGYKLSIDERRFNKMYISLSAP